jgi:hypothetical protein
MIRELDTIVLSQDLDEYGLKQGDIGAVVHVYNNDAAYEVEFVTGEGETVALLTLTPQDIRPMREREILHVRELMAA